MTASNLISTWLGESFAVTCVTSIRYVYCLHCSWLALQSIISNGCCAHACAPANGDQPFTVMHTWNDSQGVFLFDFSVYSEKCRELLDWILPARVNTRNRRTQWTMSMIRGCPAGQPIKKWNHFTYGIDLARASSDNFATGIITCWISPKIH